jgi:hypothetical protein
MNAKRFSALVSVALLWLLALVVGEASLAALLVVFSFILKLTLLVQIGDEVFGGYVPGHPYPQVVLFNAASVVSFGCTAACGLMAAAWKFRRWRPAR